MPNNRWSGLQLNILYTAMSIVISTLAICPKSFAVEGNPLTHFKIISDPKPKAAKLTIRELSLTSIAFKTKLKAKHSDLVQNPKGELSEWEGVLVRDLLTKAELAHYKDSKVTITATDDFFALYPVKLAIEHDVMIANKKNGDLIPWNKGGLHTIYPTQDPTLPEYYRKFAHAWAWSVAALFLGDVRPILTVDAGKSVVQIDLRQSKAAQTRRGLLQYPVGYREKEAARSELTLAVLPLADFLASCCKSPKFSKISVQTYNGRENILDSSAVAEFEFVIGVDGALVKPEFGGPIQLCRKGSIAHCTYYVERLRLIPWR